jgi:hypothetical protein
MKIGEIGKIYSFTGKKELKQFRKNADEVLRDIDNIQSDRDYSSIMEQNKDIQYRLYRVLFIESQLVGKKFATQNDEKVLSRLKDAYINSEPSNLENNDEYKIVNKFIQNINF